MTACRFTPGCRSSGTHFCAGQRTIAGSVTARLREQEQQIAALRLRVAELERQCEEAGP